MLRSRRVALAALALAMVFLTPFTARAGTAGVFAGTGSSHFADCERDSLSISIEGAETTPGSWTFSVQAVNQAVGCGDFPAISVPFAGEWSPAGGCVPILLLDLLVGPTHLCLSGPQGAGPATIYDLSFCEQPEPCADPDSPDRVTAFVAEA